MSSLKNQRGFGVIGVIAVIIILALIGAGGWYVWQAQNQQVTPTQTAEQPKQEQTTDSNIIALPEFNAEFIKVTGITPTYIVQDHTVNGVVHKLFKFSSKELSTKAATAGAKDCEGFSLITMYAFNSQDDLLKAMENRGVTVSDINKEAGYIPVGQHIAYVPRGIESGTGTCLNDGSDFEQIQRQLLRQSLDTLRPMH